MPETTDHQPLVRHFRFHWKDGKKDEASGGDVAKAFSALGYGGGAIAALDYYEEISETATGLPPRQNQNHD